MNWVLSLTLIIIFQFIFLDNSFAQEIKYSFGPVCKNSSVVCKGLNEVPTCIATDVGIHLQTVLINDRQINKYQPSCGVFNNTSYPTCVDITRNGHIAPKHIVIECVEFPNCKQISQDKLIAVCSDGKIPKCLGDDEEPSCTLSANSFCRKGVAVCDYTWQASVSKSTYQ